MKTVVISKQGAVIPATPESPLLLYGVTSTEEFSDDVPRVYDIDDLLEPVFAMVRQGATAVIVF